MIKGEKIILRVVEKGDLDEIYRLKNSFSEIGEFYPCDMVSDFMIQERYAQGRFWGEAGGTMLITSFEGEILGEISYFKGVHYLNGYEIGYRIFKKEYRGKGYCSEALKLFSAYLFAAKTIERLEVRAVKENIASIKIAEKCGYQREGLLRKGGFQGGAYHDLVLFSLIREDIPSLKEQLNWK